MAIKSVTEIKDLPTEESYVIFEEDTYCYSTGYEKEGEYGSRANILLVKTVNSLEELKKELANRLSPTPSYSNRKKFSIAKLVPMRYNINIETAITLS